MRQFAIGDIHGCLTALQVLDKELAFGDGDTVVTLGDYVDRGPDSRGVIEFLLGLRKRCKLVALRGNHEIMMLMARNDRSLLVNWVACGGGATLDSYGAAGFHDIPGTHWDFIADTAATTRRKMTFMSMRTSARICRLQASPTTTCSGSISVVPSLHTFPGAG
jgi:serine/threonine protein phosphatase 1